MSEYNWCRFLKPATTITHEQSVIKAQNAGKQAKRAARQQAECPTCGRVFSVNGIGAHRKACRG
jgi:hypothetical protein